MPQDLQYQDLTLDSALQQAQSAQQEVLTQQELYTARTRSRGILLVVFFTLVAFSLVWYVVAPGRSIELVEAEMAEAELIADMDPFYVLLIGSDSRKGTPLYTGNKKEEGQVEINADVLTLVRIDPVNRVLTFLTIPRDTISSDGKRTICTWLEEGKPEAVIKEVEKLTGVDIPYYAMVSFTGFENLVDAIGGVQVDVPTKVNMVDPTTGKEVRINAGPDQLLNGSQALAVASTWDNGNELEPLRQACVRAIEQAFIDKVAQGDEEFIRRVVTVFDDNVKTNMEDTLLVALAFDYATHTDDYTIYAGSGPYQGSMNNKKQWLVARDIETWAACMEVVDAGGDPNTVVVSFTSGK